MVKIMLVTSSFLGTVVLHAFHRRHSTVHFLSLCQTMLSLLHYGMVPPSPSIRALDMGFAISFFCQGMYQLAKEQSKLIFMVWLVGLLYGAERWTPNEKHKTFIHCMLHIVVCVGLHLYLFLHEIIHFPATPQ